jgi:hypothetical protein
MNARKARELFELLKTTVMDTESADNLAQAIKELITNTKGIICYYLLGLGEVEFQQEHQKARESIHDTVTYIDCDRWMHPIVLF